ncbi:MAG: GTP-binding protein, partial [Eubacteriales bacterium]|nr:GTP-binding protein [Eubacteriales bacterium]
CCHHHDHDEDHECCHHHDHEEHEHHHHEEGCTCGCHDHEHGHHHADEIFSSWGFETPRKYTAEEISGILDAFEDWEKFGTILRAKGFVDGKDGEWIYFDYVPDEKNIRSGAVDVTGRICVIGSQINESALKELFGID